MNKLLLALLLLASIPAQADDYQNSLDSLAQGLQADREYNYRKYNDSMNRLWQQPPVIIVAPNNGYYVPPPGNIIRNTQPLRGYEDLNFGRAK